jgi:hypothetical protein
MTVKRAKIQIDVEATTEGAVRGMDRVASATEKSRKAVEKNDAALKKARLEYQVAQARAENLAAAQAKLTAKFDAFARASDRSAAAQKQASAANDRGAIGLGDLAKGAGRAAGAVGAMAAVGVVAYDATTKLANESLKVTAIFDNLPYPLAQARAATHGLVDEMTLATAASSLNSTRVATNAQDFAQLAEAAQKLGARIGLDAKGSLDSLTAALARGSTEMLDNLGIVLKQEQAHEEYARTLGTTVDKLSEEQKAEAFREVAMKKVIEAARGIKIDTDSASAAVKRFENELDRLQLKALGASEPTVSLADGVATLDAKLLRGIDSFDTYGSAADDVRIALRDAGVDVEKYRNQQELLARDLTKVLAREGDRIVKLAEEGKLTNDLVDDIERLRQVKGVLSEVDEKIIYQGLKDLDIRNEQERVEARRAASASVGRNERLLEIEEQLAFGRAAQIDQAQINALLAEEAELRALALEAEGKQAEAAEIRRKAQLDALSALGEASAPRRSGGRRRRTDDGERAAREAVEQQRKVAEEIDGLMMNMHRRRMDRAAELDPFSEQNLEIQAEAEAARLAALDEAEAAYHEAAMARLEARKAAEDEVHARKMSIAQESMDLAVGAAAAIVQGAVIEGKALRQVVATTAKGEAMRHGLILGPSALAGAAFQFAWGNIPQGTALLASAGQSFAFAAGMAALGGAVGAFGGGGGRGKQVSGGFGADAFGGGPTANDSPRSASGGGWDIGGSVPLSQETKRRTSSSAVIGTAWSSGPVVQQNINISALDINDGAANKIVQAIHKAGQRQGRLTAAGGMRFG